MPTHFCQCRACKKKARLGLVLGTRKMGFWLKQFGRVEYYFGPVSDYVRHHRFNGKRPDPKFNPRDITE